MGVENDASTLPSSMATLRHGSFLPRAITATLISQREKLVLAFLLEFLHDEGLDAPLFLSGGYVRDLLLGQPPQDLDISIDLRACPPDVSIGSLTAALPLYADKRPELGVCDVELKTALSDASRAKAVDTAKIRLSVGGERLTVDVMPTIGLEVYDEGDRVPRRDVRGSPQQDALRRDLTVGSLLLHVTRGQAWVHLDAPPPPTESFVDARRGRHLRPIATGDRSRRRCQPEERGPKGSDRPVNLFEWLPVEWAWNAWAARRGLNTDVEQDRHAAHTAGGARIAGAAAWRRAMAPAFTRSYMAASAASSLQYRLLDWYGGLVDLKLGLLRSPYPRDLPLAEVWAEALPTEAERRLAARVGIGTRLSAKPAVWACGSRLGAACRSEASWAFGSSNVEGGLAKAAAPLPARFRQNLAVPGDGALVSCSVTDASVERQAMLQTVWWVKVLRDDPVRLVRALRFRATLRFELHDAFWLAAPLAVSALHSKVAGSRKAAELRKVARSGGVESILIFYELACGRSIGSDAPLALSETEPPAGEQAEATYAEVVEQADGGEGADKLCKCLAPALFGDLIRANGTSDGGISYL